MRERPWVSEAAWHLAAAALALIAAACVLELWNATISHALSYSWDAFLYQGFVKTTLEHGWYLNNPDLGAPFGLDGHDFSVPSNDALQLLIVKALGLVFDSVFTVTNVFFLLSFPLCALTASWVLRRLGVSPGAGLVAAVLFAVLPYHFLKGEQQLFFSSYYGVPLGALLVLRAFAGQPLSGDRRQTLLTVGMALVVAATSVYYAVFTALLLVAAIGLRLLLDRRVRPLAGAALAVAVIGTVGVLLQSPTLIYRAKHGDNALVAQRDPADSEYFGLKLDQMVFPIAGHRIDALSDFTDDYNGRTRMLGEPTANLGLFAVIGLGWLLLVAVASGLSTTGRRLGRDLDRHLAAATLSAFLLATAGGLSAVIGFALTSQIRSWGRMSIVIGFFALLAFALLLDRARPRLGRAGFVVALVAVLVVGVLDQTSTRYRPDYAALDRLQASDAGFVHALERTLPPDSMVLQLPYLEYPEARSFWGPSDYEPMRGYLQSRQLRWTYAAMKGRPADWLATQQVVPLRTLLDGAAAAGFAAVYVDRQGYADRAAALEGELGRALSSPIRTSADGNLLAWDLRPYASALRRRLSADQLRELADATVRPVRVEWGEDFGEPEGTGADQWRWTDERSEVVLVNDAERPRRVRFSARLRTDSPVPGRVNVRFPDGTSAAGELDSEGTDVARTFTVPPGRSRISFEATAPPVPLPPGDNRRLVLQVFRPVLRVDAPCGRPRCDEGPAPQVR